MIKPNFLRCKHCGNLIGFVEDEGVPIICCGERMDVLVPNASDGAAEKHVPVITREGNTVTVKVGGAPHPMLPEHQIEWIYLLTEQGGQRKPLAAGGLPEANFALIEDDEVIEAYEYCNLHGLWMGKP